jgi:hypothetical protein
VGRVCAISRRVCPGSGSPVRLPRQLRPLRPGTRLWLRRGPRMLKRKARQVGPSVGRRVAWISSPLGVLGDAGRETRTARGPTPRRPSGPTARARPQPDRANSGRAGQTSQCSAAAPAPAVAVGLPGHSSGGRRGVWWCLSRPGLTGVMQRCTSRTASGVAGWGFWIWHRCGGSGWHRHHLPVRRHSAAAVAEAPV